MESTSERIGLSPLLLTFNLTAIPAFLCTWDLLNKTYGLMWSPPQETSQNLRPCLLWHRGKDLGQFGWMPPGSWPDDHDQGPCVLTVDKWFFMPTVTLDQWIATAPLLTDETWIYIQKALSCNLSGALIGFWPKICYLTASWWSWRWRAMFSVTEEALSIHSGSPPDSEATVRR